jgi:hypothetical protein
MRSSLMSMWCTSRLKREVFIFRSYLFKKFIFAACLPKCLRSGLSQNVFAKAGSSGIVSLPPLVG